MAEFVKKIPTVDSDGVVRMIATPKNWRGVRISNQEEADRLIPLLLQVECAVRFLSAEPLLGPVLLLPKWLATELPCPDGIPGCEALHLGPPSPLSWVIVGGESGHGARPMELDWARSLVRQCQRAGVPVYLKQLGAAASDPVNGIAGKSLVVPAEAAPLISLRLRDPKGSDESEWPADLRGLRQFPQPAGGPTP